ncbi:MAG: hypothetical protein ACSW8G_05915 [Bacillota bacterium]
MKKQNNAKAGRTLIILLVLALVLALVLIVFGCSHKSKEETAQTTQTTQTTETVQQETTETADLPEYTFRNNNRLQEHYRKHGREMGFSSAEEYTAAANAVIANPDALTKREKEDGDYLFYVESTNEFVVLSTDGYIRTYFCPDSGKRYFDKQ